MTDKVQEAIDYLKDGGLGEVIGLAADTQRSGLPKVQMDTEMALALCQLAGDGLKYRRAH